MQLRHGFYGSALAASATGTTFGRRKEKIVALLANGADPNMQIQSGIYGSLLAVAAAYGGENNRRFLIDNSAIVDMELQHGDCGSALAWAAYKADSRSETVATLVALGADVNLRLSNGKFATALAAANGRLLDVEAPLKDLRLGGPAERKSLKRDFRHKRMQDLDT
ncbi:uncharacterized protein RSE6_14403 [Rhynchosporium secalis]|uniref:Uncharacterized protein n=1 Tax=Rhynchosporium secalis TaxID=38038 RepID=A0A1E1MV79_RHYSE|nr:uncharacterized protein RSE6_14403 [Rhynchosporium secalis]